MRLKEKIERSMCASDVRDFIDGLASGQLIPTVKILEDILASDEGDYLLGAADAVRRKHKGDEIYLRAIIEFSNYCRRMCKYCGINAENSNVNRYRMSPADIVSNSCDAANAGYTSIILQSGEDVSYDGQTLAEIIRAVKGTGVDAVTLGFGERTAAEYRLWHEAGADRYLLKHETADSGLYAFLHPDSSLSERVWHLKALRESGFQIGSGFMVGLPGQTKLSHAKDLMLLYELGIDMAGIGPFISHPQTQLAGSSNGSADTTLMCVALARLLCPDSNLPATTALNLQGREYTRRVLAGGANVIMQKVEPHAYRMMYEIYPKEIKNIDTIKGERDAWVDFIESCGRTVSRRG